MERASVNDGGASPGALRPILSACCGLRKAFENHFDPWEQVLLIAKTLNSLPRFVSAYCIESLTLPTSHQHRIVLSRSVVSSPNHSCFLPRRSSYAGATPLLK